MVVKHHFSDCPYGCNDSGKLMDPVTGNFIECPYCSKKRKILLMKGNAEEGSSNRETPLNEILGIKSPYLSRKFIYDETIPDMEKNFIEEDSIKEQKEFAEGMYTDLSIGKLPESSVCFGLSIKSRVDKFVYPMLAQAYLGGLTVTKFVTCTEFNRMQRDSNNTLKDFFDSDFVMMLLNEGFFDAELESAKGLMQTRALRGLPTIFVTTWKIESCSALLGNKNDESTMFLAKPIFLEYKKSAKKGHSSYINGLLGVENKQSGSSQNIGGVSMADLTQGL